MKNCLSELREEKGWSQGDLAEALEVSRQTINSLERGKYDPSCLLYTSPSPRDGLLSRMPSSA